MDMVVTIEGQVVNKENVEIVSLDIGDNVKMFLKVLKKFEMK